VGACAQAALLHTKPAAPSPNASLVGDRLKLDFMFYLPIVEMDQKS
jgi:hypothetical protein